MTEQGGLLTPKLVINGKECTRDPLCVYTHTNTQGDVLAGSVMCQCWGEGEQGSNVLVEV